MPIFINSLIILLSPPFWGRKQISKKINTYPRTRSPTSKLRPHNNEAQNPHHFAHLHLPAVAITSWSHTQQASTVRATFHEYAAKEHNWDLMAVSAYTTWNENKLLGWHSAWETTFCRSVGLTFCGSARVARLAGITKHLIKWFLLRSTSNWYGILIWALNLSDWSDIQPVSKQNKKNVTRWD